MDRLVERVSVAMAERSSRRGIMSRTGKAVLGVALVGTAGRAVAPATAGAQGTDPWVALESTMEAAVAAESAALVASGSAGCCYCWSNCNGCRPGYFAKVYDCPCNPNPGSQQARTRTVCTNRCCDNGGC
jgi:alkylhydroperoxidase family enzyme